jgi:hypothetical protein
MGSEIVIRLELVNLLDQVQKRVVRFDAMSRAGLERAIEVSID